MGLSTFMDTLASQAYGAGNYKMVGLITQRASMFFFITCLPILLLWTQCAPILTALKQDAGIAAQAAVYIRGMMPGLFPVTQLQLLNKYMNAQKITHLNFWVGLVGTAFHLCMLYLFLGVWRTGYQGFASFLTFSSSSKPVYILSRCDVVVPIPMALRALGFVRPPATRIDLSNPACLCTWMRTSSCPPTSTHV